jgi:hypothetical protein
LEGWNSTIELHPRIENLSHRERDCVQIAGFLPTTCTKNTPNMTKEIHSMPFDWARIGHEVTSLRHDLPMTPESDNEWDHEVKSISEMLMKGLWALFFGIGWFGAILNAFMSGAWIGIIIMIPVSFLYYYVLIKKDAISRW